MQRDYHLLTMRFLLAGFLVVLLPAVALAQATGQVLSIGFNNLYRPDCWTPMLVQITNHSAENTAYQINVEQEDLDRDRVSFGPQNVTLGGNAEGQNLGDKFWIYFRPQPSGLPECVFGGNKLGIKPGRSHAVLVWCFPRMANRLPCCPLPRRSRISIPSPVGR